jgi:NADPH:quinone reductase-like Zn-dependent oxidoreductase
MTTIADTGLQIRSLIKKSGELELTLASVKVPEPRENEVLVRVEATPLNPSDLGLLFGPADMAAAKFSGSADSPVVTAPVPQAAMPGLAARLDQQMPVGNEGAGVVVKAGSAVKDLLGKTVSMIGGGMYAQYRCLKASDCQVLPEGTTPADGASWFVNPMTALGMTETMRREGHTALVHTAAASNLGQMLNKICIKDGIALVNIVRNEEQANILKKIGAKYVIDSSSPNFIAELTRALAETKATIAFDAIRGGRLASQILSSMEAAANLDAKTYSRYGSDVRKQVYAYGRLNTSMMELGADFGFAWSVSGWLLTPFLQQIGPADTQRLRARVASELKTTFASHYAKTISLREALTKDAIAVYNKRATGEKYLIDPTKG